MPEFKRTSVIVALALSSITALAAPIFANEQTPTQTYMDYRKALAEAKTVDGIKPFMCKSVVKEIDSTPTDMKPMMFGFIKDTAPKEVKVSNEKVEGDHATLTLAATSTDITPAEASRGSTEKTEGKVTLIKESNVWKVEKESWKSDLSIK